MNWRAQERAWQRHWIKQEQEMLLFQTKFTNLNSKTKIFAAKLPTLKNIWISWSPRSRSSKKKSFLMKIKITNWMRISLLFLMIWVPLIT